MGLARAEYPALRVCFTVRFSTLPAALADLLRQESSPATERRLKRYTFPDVLILHELGYVPCDSRAADLLFHIVSRRHEKRSVVLTTNLAYKQWGSVFHDPPASAPSSTASPSIAIRSISTPSRGVTRTPSIGLVAKKKHPPEDS